ncbi:MAG: DUF4433 domain-containing protein [Chloroflexota bacterium]|nr:DUF4433 domain-containing protein [Chloroflexota bacterium]
MLVPSQPKIYHIVHVDRLSSIIADGHLWCDAHISRHGASGTTIGMNNIKQRRLTNALQSHRGLHVGDCVPFYFCPRSVMLFIIHRRNDPGLKYRGGQDPILHLEADLHQTVAWANQNDMRWVFTTSNAGSYYFEDYSDLSQLHKVDWDAVRANQWRGERKHYKQAEFLIEHSFPWELISRIGTNSIGTYRQAARLVRSSAHRPTVVMMRRWYYR